MPRSFEFQEGDAAALAALCTQARKFAKNNILYTPDDGGNPKYGFTFGAWNLHLTIDAFSKETVWHASAAIMEEVADQEVILDSGLVARMPQDALLTIQSWTEEHKQQADFLLGELLSPVILKEDQKVTVHDGFFARHWVTEFRRK